VKHSSSASEPSTALLDPGLAAAQLMLAALGGA
jgi:hypothetical protein